MATNKNPDIPVSSFVSKLTNAKESTSAFLTSGYVGAVDDKSVRLYLDLTLDTFVDIPRSAVLHAQKIENDQHERSELIINANSQMVLVHQQKRELTPADFQLAQIKALNEKARETQGQGSSSPPPSQEPAEHCCVVHHCCRCAGSVAGSPAPANQAEPAAGPDLLRAAGKAALGPFGFIVDLF